MFFFDTHTHITKARHMTAETYLKEASAAGVIGIFDAGIRPDDFEKRYQTTQRALKDADLHDDFVLLYGAAAAPHHSSGWTSSVLDDLESLLKSYPAEIPVVGEIGLEYFQLDNKDEQKKLFASQLEIAAAYGKPVELHIRDAFADAREIAGSHLRVDGRPEGTVHCFTGTKEDARRFLDLGYMISFSGIVTFGKSKELKDVLRYVPSDRILVETDSPWLSPDPHRGQKNDSSRIPVIVRYMASERQETEKGFAEQVYKNSLNFFGLLSS